MWNLLVFSFERAIAYSPVGFLVALFASLFIGKFLVRAGKSVGLRTAVYSGLGSIGVVWDYSTQRAIEFHQLPMYVLAVLLVAAFLWVALVTFPFVITRQWQRTRAGRKVS